MIWAILAIGVAAAFWWALSRSSRVPKPDRPDQIRRTAEAAADWWGRQLPRDLDDKRLRFEAELAAIVERKLRALGTASLRCDNDPKFDLLEALRAADIPVAGPYSGRGLFAATKTSLVVHPGRLYQSSLDGEYPDPEPEIVP